MRALIALFLSAITIMAFTTSWMTYHAVADLTGSSTVIFNSSWAIAFRFALGAAATITTLFLAYYVLRLFRLRDQVKLSVSHYVRNRLQVVMLSLEMLEPQHPEKNELLISRARETCDSALKELDLIVAEKLLVDEDNKNKFWQT